MRTWKLLGTLGILTTAAVVACNNTTIGGDNCTDPNNCVQMCTDPNGCNPQPGPEYTAINISPSPVTIQANGQPTTKQLTATGTKTDGTMSSQLIGVNWSAPVNPIGTIDASGVFTANGNVGGTVTVTATYVTNGVTLTSTVQITVNVNKVVTTPNTDPNAPTLFMQTPTMDTTKAPAILYPLDGVMMPQNVYPADIQWSLVGTMGDIYRVTITKTNITTVAYVGYNTAAFNFDYLVDSKAWASIAQSNLDDDAVLTVDRYEKATGKVWSGTPVKMHFANGSLLGTVYYWDINVGRIRKIQDGTATATDLIPTAPASPNGSGNCIGCHAVSRDGRYMMGRLGGGINYGALFDLTANLQTNPAPTVYPVTTATQTFYFSSFSPDSKRLVIGDPASGTNRMYFIDAANGKVVPPVTGAFPTAATYPAWSPDGKTIAFASETNNDGTGMTSSNLSVIPVTGPDAVGSVTKIHTANTVAGSSENSFPTWSPDSKWIAFQNGPDSRSDNQRLGALYMIKPDGTGLVKLAKAMGATATAPTTRVFFPNFSPFNVGGYFWVSFISERDYGNSKVGTAGTIRQQLWVAAIKNSPVPGEDPSFVPYWLPGQNVAAKNISAYWAPVACRQDGAAADVASQCCSNVISNGVCATPMQCIPAGQTCGGGGCCGGLVCSANVCTQPVG